MCFAAGARWLIILLASVSIVLPLLGQAKSSQACVAEIVAYSPTGNRLPTELVSIRLVAHKEIELLGRRVDGMLIQRGIGTQILFSGRNLVEGPEVEITLRGATGRLTRARRVLPACGARVSIIDYGLLVGHELSGIRAKGELTGCSNFGTDWWVRAVPIFGEAGQQVEAVVESSGHFSLYLPLPIRHCILIGRGKDVVKAQAIDILSARDIDLGRFSVEGPCR